MNIGVIGLGTVGQGLLEILEEKTTWISKKFGMDVMVVAVKDMQKGNIYDPNGIDLPNLLRRLGSDKGISDGTLEEEVSLSSLNDIDLVVEATYSDYKTGDPAYTFIREALVSGKHVVTTNKGPIALHYEELNEIARANNVSLCFEGTVLSGTPTFSLFEDCLAGDDITAIRGILNGTCNFMLCKMAAGVSFENALVEAQEKGYAEADSTNDVKGLDARGKVAILSHKIFSVGLELDTISTIGIDQITSAEFDAAKKANQKIRLVGSIEKVNGIVGAKVRPEALGVDDALYHIEGVTNALEVTTAYLGKIMIAGPGAGDLATGYAVFSDILRVVKTLQVKVNME